MRYLLLFGILLAGISFAQPAGKLSGTPEQKAAQAAKAAKYRSDQAIHEQCDRDAKAAQNVSVKHPAKVTPYPVAYKRCMDSRRSK